MTFEQVNAAKMAILHWKGAFAIGSPLRCNVADLSEYEMNDYGNVPSYMCSDYGMNDYGMKVISHAASVGVLPHLTHLYLCDNQIGDTGIINFAKAVYKGALAPLKELLLAGNQISVTGMSALASACASGTLDKLTYLDLSENAIGDVGLQALAEALSSGVLDKLQVSWHPTALSSCPETSHMHSPNSYLLFDVPYAASCSQHQWNW